MRDFVGYGQQLPVVAWPGGARIAISIVVNYEEGAESSPAENDDSGQQRLEMPHTSPRGRRDLGTESLYEYGSRRGIWRILELLGEANAPATVFACARALEQNLPLAAALRPLGHEVCSHGDRWIEPTSLTDAEEAESIRRAVGSIVQTTGARPVGWYSRWGASERTRSLLAEEGGFLYDSDSYSDDLPYYTDVAGAPFLVLPYAMDANDMKFWAGGYTNGDSFLDYLKDSFTCLYREGATTPRMLSIGLHARIIGRPGRAEALRRFLEFANAHPDVWFARRDEIAAHWREKFPPGN